MKHKRTRCEYCNKLYYGIGTHQAKCKAKRKWEKKLTIQGVIEEDKQTHFSGGMKIYLLLGRGRKTDEDKIFHNNLINFEKKHNVRVEYDHINDEIYLK